MLINRALNFVALVLSSTLAPFWEAVHVTCVPVDGAESAGLDKRATIVVIPGPNVLGRINGEVPSYCLDPDFSPPVSRASIFMRTRIALEKGARRSGLLLEYVPCETMAEGGAWIWYDHECGGAEVINPKPIGNCATAWKLKPATVDLFSATLADWDRNGRRGYVAPETEPSTRKGGAEKGHAVSVKSYMKDPLALLASDPRFANPFAMPIPSAASTADKGQSKRRATVTD